MLEREETYKCIGLVIDCRFSWKLHVDFIKSKVKPILALLRREAYMLPSETKL